MRENLPEEKLLKLIRTKKGDEKKPVVKPLVKASRGFDLKYMLPLMNGALTLGALGLMGFLFYHVFFVVEEKEAVVFERALPLTEEPLKSQEPLAQKKPFEYYNGQFVKRDLFTRPLNEVAANASVDLTKRYKLVGIVLGDVPEAIIEDLTARNTVFVHEGQRLDAVEVKRIEEGRIIFLQEGLEIELKQ
jgi:hypothetical protein